MYLKRSTLGRKGFSILCTLLIFSSSDKFTKNSDKYLK